MQRSSSSPAEPIKVLGQSMTLVKVQEMIGSLYELPVVGGSLICT